MRLIWGVIYLFFFRFSPTPFHLWRRILLRFFGASIGNGVLVYPSAKVWAPWNLIMEDGSCLGPFVDCYSVDTISIGRDSVISQRSFLCTAGHDYTKKILPLISAPIVIEGNVWVTAEVYIAPGITMGEGSVALPRAVVIADVMSWDVVAGNPAGVVRKRSLNLQETV